MNDLLLNNRYRLKQLIGTGGMADVYLAYDTTLEREVAIKILHANLAKDLTFIENFWREAKAAGKLVHPNIVGIYDVGEDHGRYYIVMEYVTGGHTLKDELESRQLSIKESLGIALSISRGLKAAHEMGFVHCDIKPQNILLTENGDAKITDFGIARIISSTSTLIFGAPEIMGTAHYISPEQAQGNMVDYRSDLYSLGVVLYEMLAGEKAFDGENPVSIALKHIQEHPLPLSVCQEELPADICYIVEKLMEKEANYRYSSIDDLIDDLNKVSEHYGDDEKLPIKRTSLENSALRNRRKQKEAASSKLQSKKIWIPSLILLFLLSLGGVFWMLSDPGGKEVEVPKVEGMAREEAIKQIEAVGLKVEITESADAQNGQGKVVKQSPIGGTKVKVGRVITLVVSGKDSGKATVPSLAGLSVKDSEALLTKLDLTIGKVSVGWDTSKPAGTVLNQSIRAGDSVAKKTAIDITVNPEGSISLPDVQEKNIKEAESILKTMGLQIMIQESSITGKKQGTIVDQSPAPGSSMLNGGQVTLFVIPAVKQRTVSISYTVPGKEGTVPIRIIKSGNGDDKTLFSEDVKAGNTVKKSFEISSDEKIKLYADDKLIEAK